MEKTEGAIVIDTRMDYKKIEADFEKINNKTKNMINRYNKSVDSIKKQELALEKVKQKLNDIQSGNKVPTSIKSMETELKKVNKELENYELQFQEIENQQQSLSVQITTQQELGELANVEEIKKAQSEIERLDNVVMDLSLKEELAKNKSQELTNKLSNAKNNSVEVQHLKQQIDNMNNSLEESKKQTIELGIETKKALNQKASILGIGDEFDKVGQKIDKFKARMTHLIGTVAIFSLMRTGLTNLRNQFTSLLKTNDSFNASLNQIKANLMTAFAPIYNACLPAINSLMSSLSKLTGTLAIFISGLFGTSLEDAKKQAQGLSSSLQDVEKSGESASKGLSSLDEIENLNQDSGSGTNVNSSSGIDYKDEIQYSKKLLDTLNKIKDFIVDNSDEIIASIAGITGALIAMKVLGLAPIKALGLGATIAGIIYALKELKDYLEDPSFENFGGIFQGIGMAIIGVGAMIGGLPVVVTGAIVLIWGTIVKYWEQIKEFLQSGIDWLTDKSDWIHEHFGSVIGNIYDGFVENLQGMLNWVDFLMNGIKANFDEIINFVKNVFSGNWEGALENLKNIFVNIFSSMKETAKLVLSSIINGAKITVQTAASIIGNIFKAIINALLSRIENILNKPIFALNGLIDKINTIPGVNFDRISTFKLPRLATGAVIPPNSEFMAVLGDQKRGVNIETPLSTMLEAFNKALDSRGGDLNTELLLELNKNISDLVNRPMILNINGKSVAQATYKDFENERNRLNYTTSVSLRNE